MRARAALVVACVCALFAACGLASANPATRPPCPAVARTNARAVLDRFIATAVRRHSTGCSWPLVSHQLRRGFTRRTWARGDIPVVPFLTRGRVTARVLRHFTRRPYDVSVALLSMSNGDEFRAELRRRHKHWRITYWMPDEQAGAPAQP